MKKVLAFVLTFSIFMVYLLPISVFADENLATISIKNSLNFPIYKTVEFSVEIPNIDEETDFALKDQEELLPLDLVKKDGDIYVFRTIISLGATEEKKLLLTSLSRLTEYNKIFLPDFSGTNFMGIGSGKLAIASLQNNNSVSVTSKEGEIYEGILQEKETKIINLSSEKIFRIESSQPIFAFVSSLTSNPENTSSDDFSSVYGTHFILYIPRQIFVSTLKPNRIKLTRLDGKVIYDGDLQERGVYSNLKLDEDFYELYAEEPVNVIFGYIDDNIYGILYGDINAYKGISFGNIVVSSLYPETSVEVKTLSSERRFVLSKKGDMQEVSIISSFKDNYTEFAPVYITYSKPVFICSDSNYGNLGGEQIPSIDFRNYVFYTGKVYNIGELKRNVSVAIIAEDDGTEVTVNGDKFNLGRFDYKQISFDKSHCFVEVSSNKTVSVFEIGLNTTKEFFSTLLPINDNSVSTGVVVFSNNTPGNGNINNGNSSEIGVVVSIKAFFSNLWTKITGLFQKLNFSAFFENTKVYTKNFFMSVKQWFEQLLQRLILLLMPIADYVYPYISRYFPQITREEIAVAIIVVILLLILLVILLPRRKKKKEIPIVSIEEAKKRSVNFNVKTIEESETVPSEVEIKPPTIKIEKEKLVETPEEQAAITREEIETKPVSEKEKPFMRTLPPWRRPLKPEQKKKEEETTTVTPVKEEIILEEVKPEEEKLEVPPEIEEIPEERIEPQGGKERTKIPISKEVQEKPEGPSFEEFAQPSGEYEATQSFDAFAQPEGYIEEEKELPVEEAKKTTEEITEEKSKEEGEVFLSKLEESISGEKKSESKDSTFDLLLKKIEEHEKIYEEELQRKESEKGEEKEEQLLPKETIKKKFGGGVVLDSDSLLRIISVLSQNERVMFFEGKAFISAKERSKISPKNFDPSYKIGVIALTDIEERLAQDISKRIGGKYTTAEAILVAKKIRIKDVLVNDVPKIMNFQGININKVSDVL